MDKLHMFLIFVLAVLVYLYYTKSLGTGKSNYSSVIPKPASGQCPAGYSPLYDTLCAKA
jgi:hypothetical protein